MADIIVSPKNKIRVKPLLIALIVIVLAGGAGVGMRLWQGYHNRPKPKTLPAVIQDSVNLSVKGDFATAHKELNTALQASNLTNQQKFELYVQQASTHYNEAKYQQALDSFKKATAFKETQGIYVSLAQTSELLGDNQAAVGYYKKAIAFISATNPVGGADKEAYEQRIRELGGQP